MRRFLKTVGRELLLSMPVVREKFLDYDFGRRRQSFRGVYGSFGEALKGGPARKPAGYEHEEDTGKIATELEKLNPADYPVLFWLERLLPKARTVFDLGGNLGVAFYSFRRHLVFPPHLRWTVCEIASTVQAGRALAEERAETQLFFTEDRALADGVDVLFTAGALQYIEEPLDEMLGRLAHRPRHVIVQRVPLHADQRFVTLQNNGSWVVPYQVAQEDEFVRSLLALGYEQVDRWPTWRTLQVAHKPADLSAPYVGMYFRRS